MKRILTLAIVLFTHHSLGQTTFQTYDLVVSDPAAVVAAIDKYQASPTGQSNSASVVLYAYVAAGDNLATHAINVVHPSPSDMDANLALNESQDQAVFLAEIREVATVTSRAMGETLLIGGNPENITSANPAVMRYLMSVSDPAAYAQAFSSFLGQNPDIGVSYLSSMMADGTNPETHVVLNYANSVGELFINQPQTLEGWAEYSSAVKGLRTIESTAIATEVKRWVP
ncbi:MAG: hypothetical protein CBD23_009105 [Gammaproteobacteria bacterium TMED163]|nr:MAG: hypothetical protein CBD23_009105 [Gammaproteobacteria bacterium TMED163]